jgi:hypothetical protein
MYISNSCALTLQTYNTTTIYNKVNKYFLCIRQNKRAYKQFDVGNCCPIHNIDNMTLVSKTLKVGKDNHNKASVFITMFENNLANILDN